MAVAGEQPHALAVALDDQAVAVVLDFVDPFRPVRDFGSAGRNAGLERGFGHGAKIGSGGLNGEFRAEKNCRIRASLAHEQRFQVDRPFLLPALRDYLHGEPARAAGATPRLLPLPCLRGSGPRMERAL